MASTDGREFVITSAKAVSVQGEDGRSITNVDISPFIDNLPGIASTQSFSTGDASGSTSMAAGVIEVRAFLCVQRHLSNSVEALELGADTLLFDEDTCATNFLVRDARMQKLISVDPITPLVFKVSLALMSTLCLLKISLVVDSCDVG